ncbi:MAG: DUF3047 domain-containing protein [Elusimicrobiota bacterium]
MTRIPLLLMFLAGPAAAGALLTGEPALGADGLPEGWTALTFRKVERHSEYRWSKTERALHATSRDAASGLIMRLSGDARKTPILRWRWRVSGILPKGDARKKSGDDYPARIYVTFKYDSSRVGFGTRMKYGLAKKLYGEYPPHAGINYIWANKLARGEAVENAYTNRVKMIAVRSGGAEAGKWLTEERNILADYRRLFGEDPPPVAGIAVMTDTDNTHGSAEAWYADISLDEK